MISALTDRRAVSHSIVLPILLLGTISIGLAQSQPLQYNRNPANLAILHDAWAKWQEAIPFEKTGNLAPAAICLQNAIRLAAQVPKTELTNGDLLLIAQIQTAYAKTLYQAIGAPPNEQAWSAYLRAADDAKTAIDSAGHAIATGQPAASALMLMAQIMLMNCDYKRAGSSAYYAEQLYPAGKSEYAKFGAFVENAQKNGTGPCVSNRVSGDFQWKKYAQELKTVFEVVDTVQTIVKWFK